MGVFRDKGGNEKKGEREARNGGQDRPEREFVAEREEEKSSWKTAG